MIHKVIIPKNRKVNLSFVVPEDYIGEEMEVIAFIKNEAVQQPEHAKFPSPAMQGDPLTDQQFINWIKQAEAMPAISLDEAKNKWAKKRIQLKQLIK